MKTLALAKQVPATTELGFDAAGRLQRRGAPTATNPDDEAAVELAALLAEATGGEAAVATMGPAESGEMLSDLVAKGCAEAWHLLDSRLEGADILLTAKALAALVGKVGARVVVTGAASADGKSGMVPPALAALLDWPFVGNVTRVASLGEEMVLFQRRGTREAKVALSAPAVLGVFKTAATPRIPDVMAILSAPEPVVLGVDDLGLGAEDLDWKSRCRVVDVLPVEPARKKRILGGREALGDLLEALRAEGL